MSTVRVELCVVSHGAIVAGDEVSLDVCDVRNLGTLYERLIDRLVKPDTCRQARDARVVDPGVRYHPWYPVLTIGGDKAALYTDALVADIVGKECHFTDPAWLLRVGVYLELLTCMGIIEAVRADVGDLLESDERDAFETSDAFSEIRRRVNPDGWREVWDRRHISFAGLGSPRLGPVSALNLLRKKDATFRFLHIHHEDLKHAIELAGPNHFNSQETWQRVFRDAERAVMRQAAGAFPELGFLPPAAERARAVAASRLRRPTRPLPDGVQPVPGVDERGRGLGEGPRVDGPRRCPMRAAGDKPDGGPRARPATSCGAATPRRPRPPPHRE